MGIVGIDNLARIRGHSEWEICNQGVCSFRRMKAVWRRGYGYRIPSNKSYFSKNAFPDLFWEPKKWCLDLERHT